MAKIFRNILAPLAAALLLGTESKAEIALAPGPVTWPANPFTYALPETTFQPTGEARFTKTARVFGETLGGVGDDLLDIFTFPLRDPQTFGLFAAGIGALVLFDKPLTEGYQATLGPIGDKYRLPLIIPDQLAALGPFNDGAYLLGINAAGMVYGLAANDERAQVAALLSSKAIAYSYLVSHVVLKPIFGRMRPVPDLATASGPWGNRSTTPYDWFNNPGLHFRSTQYATGMPSFHFTMYFAWARVWSGVYDNSVLPYIAVGAVALSNARGHHHWVSDMAAGALIGTGIGNVVLSNYYDRHTANMGVVTPVVSSQGVGLQWTMTF